MKGLLYREIYLGRKRYLIMGMLTFIISVIGILIRISMIHGNMALLDAETYNSVNNTTYYFFTFIPFVILLSSIFASVEVICDDYKYKWNVYCRTTRIKCLKWVMIKCTLAGVISVISFLYGIMYCYLISFIAKRKVPLVIYRYYVVILAVFLVVNSIAMMLAYKYKSINNVVIRIAGVISLAGVGLTVILMRNLEIFSEKHSEIPPDLVLMVYIRRLLDKIDLNNIKMCILCLVMVCILGITMFMSVKYFEKNEGN